MKKLISFFILTTGFMLGSFVLSLKGYTIISSAAFSPPAIDYFVVGVPVIKQPSMNSCWAASLAMIYSHKKKTPLTIQVAVQEFGPTYKAIFNEDQQTNKRGLKPSEANALYTKMQVRVLPPQNPTINYWHQLLKANEAPLIVVTGEKSPDSESVLYHAIVLVGMKGDGTPAGTTVTYINPDPSTGNETTQSFKDFVAWYEGGANWPGKGQIIYYSK